MECSQAAAVKVRVKDRTRASDEESRQQGYQRQEEEEQTPKTQKGMDAKCHYCPSSWKKPSFAVEEMDSEQELHEKWEPNGRAERGISHSPDMHTCKCHLGVLPYLPCLWLIGMALFLRFAISEPQN